MHYHSQTMNIINKDADDVHDPGQNMTLFRYIPSRITMQRMVVRAAMLPPQESYFLTQGDQ